MAPNPVETPNTATISQTPGQTQTFERGDRVIYDGEVWAVTGSYDRRQSDSQINLKRRGADGRISFAVAEVGEVRREDCHA